MKLPLHADFAISNLFWWKEFYRCDAQRIRLLNIRFSNDKQNIQFISKFELFEITNFKVNCILPKQWFISQRQFKRWQTMNCLFNPIHDSFGRFPLIYTYADSNIEADHKAKTVTTKNHLIMDTTVYSIWCADINLSG